MIWGRHLIVWVPGTVIRVSGAYDTLHSVLGPLGPTRSPGITPLVSAAARTSWAAAAQAAGPLGSAERTEYCPGLYTSLDPIQKAP